MRETARLAFSVGTSGWRLGVIATVYYQSQQQVSVSPEFALVGKGPTTCPQSVPLPGTAGPGRRRLSFGMSRCVCSLLLQQSLHCHPGRWGRSLQHLYTPSSSEPLCKPAVHLGNVNHSFCTHFISIYHPYLPNTEMFASCKHSPGHPTAEVSLYEEHIWGPRNLPKWLLQMTKFRTLIALCPRTKQAPV